MIGMKTVQLGGYEASFDNTDPAFLKKYEQAAAYYTRQISRVKPNGSASAMMSRVVRVFEKTFAILFGADAAAQMLGERRSVDECLSIYQALVTAVNDFSGTLEQIDRIGR